jgi:transcriptional regulator with XRE-family HTH domain
MTDEDSESRLARMIGVRIATARGNAKLSQQRLGELIGKGQGTLGHYESGRIVPPIDVLCRIATATKTTPAYLLGDIVGEDTLDWFDTELLRRTKELSSTQKFELIVLLSTYFINKSPRGTSSQPDLRRYRNEPEILD